MYPRRLLQLLNESSCENNNHHAAIDAVRHRIDRQLVEYRTTKYDI